MTEQPGELIDRAKATAVVNALIQLTQGPKEAFGVLVLAIYILNFELSDEPISIDQLAEELSLSIRSVKRYTDQ